MCAARRSSDECQSQCIHNGRYCTPDPDGDLQAGYSGKDIVQVGGPRVPALWQTPACQGNAAGRKASAPVWTPAWASAGTLGVFVLCAADAPQGAVLGPVLCTLRRRMMVGARAWPS